MHQACNALVEEMLKSPIQKLGRQTSTQKVIGYTECTYKGYDGHGINYNGKKVMPPSELQAKLSKLAIPMAHSIKRYWMPF